ncbi:MAG TPA: glycosyltransferase family 4 protein [Solirubrobacteraceae bacterium]|nr:glycosyltransferase family 4 protein [Solirubrobacteraceae bacterium]
MRVLIFHGYLLQGTGSNVYNVQLAATLARLGHEVDLVCQERDPEPLGLPAGVTVHNPDIGRMLPVYVVDHYDGFDAKQFLECTDAEIAAYIAANVAAVAEVAARHRPDVALANHLVMGPVILARALPADVPYAVKIHGSALEYVVKRDPARFLPYAREGLERARAVLVGSLHTATSLWDTLEDPTVVERTRLGPPGVDIEQFAPRERSEAAGRLVALAHALERSDATSGGGSFARADAEAGSALTELDPEHERLVLFVGKLIVSKGVDLLVAAWPLVLARVPDARLVVVGFGGYCDSLELLIAAIAAGDLEAAAEIARVGRAGEGGPESSLTMLAAFLDGLDGARRDAYVAAGAGLTERLTIVGRLDHEELAELLPLCDAQVVPSTFPEAFGMVAAEAAACGVLPVSAAHSGLQEVTRTLARSVPPDARELLSFELGAGAVEQLADRLVRWLEASPELRSATRAALVETARERFSWEGVARGLLDAAEGRLDALMPPS